MARRGRSGPKTPKPKQAKFDLIDPDMKPLLEPYRLMKEIRAEHHPDTKQAKIALAWMHGVKANTDGKVCLGKCVLAPELQKELVAWDFVILLNKEVWESKEFGVEKKKALLDHGRGCRQGRRAESGREGPKVVPHQGTRSGGVYGCGSPAWCLEA